MLSFPLSQPFPCPGLSFAFFFFEGQRLRCAFFCLEQYARLGLRFSLPSPRPFFVFVFIYFFIVVRVSVARPMLRLFLFLGLFFYCGFFPLIYSHRTATDLAEIR